MPNTDYATDEELKPRLSIKADKTPAVDLWQFLNAAAYIVDQVTRRPPRGAIAFSATAAPETRYFDDTGSGTVRIDDLLLTTPITIVRGGTTLAATDYILRPYNELPKGEIVIVEYAAPSDTTGYRLPYRRYGMRQIAVTATWGFCTLANRPVVVKEAVLVQAERMYERMGMKSRELATAIRDPWKSIDPFVMAMLTSSGLVKGEAGEEEYVV